MSDQDERTTPFGLFNYARSYWRSAATLDEAKLKLTHPDAPVLFLYVHALELYLKSLLRLNGMTVQELRSRDLGHRVCCLADKARSYGLQYEDEDLEVIALIVGMDLLDLRYIKTGPFRRPAPEALDRTCKSLDDSIGKALKAQGHPVRSFK